MSYPPITSSRKEHDNLNDKIPQSRLKHLLALKKREDLKTVLVEKFADKKNAKEKVEEFVNTAKLTEANLSRLERNIQQNGEPSEYSVATATQITARPENQATERQERWSKLDEYASYLASLDSVRAKAEHARVQTAIRQGLDRQVADRRNKSDRELQEDRRYGEALQKDKALWEAYEMKVKDERRRKAELEQKLLLEGVEEKRKRAEAERERNKQEEEAILSRIQKEMIDEKAKILNKNMKEVLKS